MQKQKATKQNAVQKYKYLQDFYKNKSHFAKPVEEMVLFNKWYSDNWLDIH